MKKITIGVICLCILGIAGLTAQSRIPPPVDSPEIFDGATAEPFEIQFAQEELKKIPTDVPQIIIASGEETKGQRYRVPYANTKGEFIQLPSDVWVDFFGFDYCADTNEDCGGLTVWMKRDGTDENLFIKQGRLWFREDQDQQRVREIFKDVINQLELEVKAMEIQK